MHHFNGSHHIENHMSSHYRYTHETTILDFDCKKKLTPTKMFFFYFLFFTHSHNWWTNCDVLPHATHICVLMSVPVETTTRTTKIKWYPTFIQRTIENYHGSNTVFLVGVLMSVVGFVFVTFTLMALCYRSVVVHRNFSLCLRLVERNN